MPSPAIDWEALASAAKAAAESAYCPYSHFSVGAAVLADDSSLFTGCNVENASYGLTICAERNAVCQLAASGRRIVRAICIYTKTETPCPPCGACRQVLQEFQRGSLAVLCVCDGATELETELDTLLPHAFARPLPTGSG
jgi:cytidine deaminase